MSKKISKLALTAVSILTVMSLTAASASAYELLPIRRNPQNRPIVMYAHTSVNSNFVNAFVNAITVWNNAGKGTLFVYGGKKSVPYSGIADGYNGFTTGARGKTTAIAITNTLYYESTKEVIESNIDVNITHPFAFSFPQSGYDAQSVLTHELGHVLGLGESKDVQATMFGTMFKDETKKRSLEQDDINGLNALGY